MSEHLEYRHFDVLQRVPQPVPNSDAKMLGSFIIGIPAMMFREFQNDYPTFELDPAILRSISPEERREDRPSSLGYDEAGYDLHSPCQRTLPGRSARRADLWRRSREKVLDLLEIRQGGGVKVFLEGDLFLLLSWVLTKNVGFALAFTVVGHHEPLAMRKTRAFARLLNRPERKRLPCF